MFLITLNIPVIELLLHLPISQIIIRSLGMAIILYLIKTILLHIKHGDIFFFIIIAISSIWYFGLVPTLFFSLIFFSSLMVGKAVHIQSRIIAFLVGFFSLVEMYILIGLLFGIHTALFVLVILSSCILIYMLLKKAPLFIEGLQDIRDGIKQINAFDFWIIICCFLIGSFPQVHWDSVYANLYNAKWYAQLNGFPILEESISSLFPQNAIAYYSLFFAVGAYKSFQIAFLLPLLAFIALLKQTAKNLQLYDIRRLIMYVFLFAPIVWFQSATGYYDLLITVLLFAAMSILLFHSKNQLAISVLTASVFIGFAAGIRHFAVVFGLLPLSVYLLEKTKNRKNIFICVLSLLLVFFPLCMWCARTFQYTGSPVFPFFQQYFPTPEFWSSGPLEQNFMIQTTMTLSQWLKGGFIAYPLLSYFLSEQFVEGTRGYPTIVYIIFMMIELFVLGRVIFRAFQRKRLDVFEWTYIYIFVAYLLVGSITRYYRYIFPYQFLFAIVSLIICIQMFSETVLRYQKQILFVGIGCIVFINTFDIFESFRFYPIDTSKMLHPDTHLYINPDTVGLINSMTSKSEIVLDLSENLLPRLYMNARVYQCNWYWIAGDKKIKNAKDDEMQSKLVQKFSYVIKNNTVTAGNYCTDFFNGYPKELRITGNELHSINRIQ